MMPLCEVISEFITSFNFSKIPDDVIQKAKMCILDTLGATLLGSTTDAAKMLNKTIRRLGLPSQATVIGTRYRTSYLYAAYANCMGAAYFELDDGHRGAGIHPGCIMVPTALAIGEYVNASGKEILEAVILGYEVAIRIGLATGISQFKRRIDPPATCGIFGAATTAGKLMKLNKVKCAHALAIAGTQSPLSPSIWYYEPSMIKSLAFAQACHNGIFSAMLAKEGFRGPLGIFEGKGGFCEAVCSPETFRLDKITYKLGEIWEIKNVYFKIYPSCRWTHSAIDAVLGILRRHKVNYQDIKEVVVKTYPTAAQLTTVEPLDDTTARLSIPYTIAVAIFYENLDLDHFNSTALRNHEILKLAKKVKIIAEPAFKNSYPEKRPTLVVIRLKNKLELSNYVEYPLGEPENPLTEEQIREKFMKLAIRAVSEEKAKEILNKVKTLETLKSIYSLTALLG
ncbi:MAG: MmgE/PrpD family protein [Nitrososphaeria archaeon]